MSAKRAAFWAMHHAGVFGALRHLHTNALLILTYHGVLPGADDRYDFLSANFVSAAAFERHMAWVASRYTPVAMRDVAAAIEGRATLPPRAAAVTFDDGFANNFHVAFPLLQRLGIPATIFLATGMIGVPDAQLWTERVKRAFCASGRTGIDLELDERVSLRWSDMPGRERAARRALQCLKRLAPAVRDAHVDAIEAWLGRPPLSEADAMRFRFLDWPQVRTMADAGIEFGSHTVSHPILSTLDADAVDGELADSKRTIEAMLGRECYSFAYPNGKADDFGPREQSALRRLGYRCAVSLQGRLNSLPADAMAIDRVNISRQFDAALFNATLTGATGTLRGIRSRTTGGGLRA